MQTARTICIAVIVVTAFHFGLAVFRDGIGHGAGTDVYFQGYFANPWQAVIDVDLMAGLTFAAIWIYWRESDRMAALTWVVVLLYWGNIVLALYVYRQLSLNDGSWERILLGRHSRNGTPVRSDTASKPRWLRFALRACAAATAIFVAEGCWSSHFAPAPVMGYVWGFGSLIPVLLLLARRHPTSAPMTASIP